MLLDVVMRDLHGDEVLKIMKEDSGLRDIPVLVISADSSTEKISKCIELGADDYLSKPFNPTILRARIGAALRREALRALEDEYISRLEEGKRHSELLLKNILPAEIAIRLRNGETNIADHVDEATVLFALPPDHLPGRPPEHHELFLEHSQRWQLPTQRTRSHSK